MRSVKIVALLAGLSILSGVASADIIQFSSDTLRSAEGLGTFEGSLDYNPGTARLTITITNTSPLANAGFVTGLAFQIGSEDPSAMAVLTTASVPFIGLLDASAAPFGKFDAGAALGGSWLGGGSPRDGIAVGETGTFEFALTASDAASLTALDFIEVASAPGPDFVVRYRGFADGASDKVPARADENVPGPGGLGVLAGLGILAARRRRTS